MNQVSRPEGLKELADIVVGVVFLECQLGFGPDLSNVIKMSWCACPI
jgi:hypothetical protein